MIWFKRGFLTKNCCEGSCKVQHGRLLYIEQGSEKRTICNLQIVTYKWWLYNSKWIISNDTICRLQSNQSECDLGNWSNWEACSIWLLTTKVALNLRVLKTKLLFKTVPCCFGTSNFKPPNFLRVVQQWSVSDPKDAALTIMAWNNLNNH